MRRLILLTAISLLSFLTAFSQSILKDVIQKKPHLKVYKQSRQQDQYIVAAALNTNTHVLHYLSCFGEDVDSVKLQADDYQQILQEKVSPLAYLNIVYQNFTAVLATAKAQLREKGRVDPSWKHAGLVKAIVFQKKELLGQLQQLAAIDKAAMDYNARQWLLNSSNPAEFVSSNYYAGFTTQLKGRVITAGDSTLFYNTNELQQSYEAVLFHRTGKVLLRSRAGKLLDSMQLEPAKASRLNKDKADIFLVYRGWLEWHLQTAKGKADYLDSLQQEITRKNTAIRFASENTDLQDMAAFHRGQQLVLEQKIRNYFGYDEKSLAATLYQSYKDRDVHEGLFRTLGLTIFRKGVVTRGEKQYELTNHLGNVLVTVSDKKLQVDNNSNGQVDYYTADVVSAQDYYPFGMTTPGRTYIVSDNYRYGFNGKEQDQDMHSLTAYDYGFRIYNPAIGRFLSVDPLTQSYPWNSPYSYAEGDVVRSIDLDGLEKYIVTYWYDNKGRHRKTVIKAIRANDSKEIMNMSFSTANGSGHLTDMNVWVRKLYLDGQQKEAPTGKDMLNASEKALFNKAKTKKETKPKEYPTILYDLGDQKGWEHAESDEFDSEKYEFREATQNIPLVTDLDQKFDAKALTYLNNDGSGGGAKSC